MAENKYKIDMCNGPLLSKMVIFVFPLLCTYALQSLFNAVDMMIVGRLVDHQAMAAIGATLNPITLVLKLFIGFSTGANVVIAHCCGAQDRRRFHLGVQTAMTIALYGGFFFMIAALAGAKPLLVLMKTPPEILPDACSYIWIYFLGIPFLMIFNIGCAVLRAVGDSRRPFYFLVTAGAINLLLNLFCVAVCGMAVAGVAVATTVSNGIAAALILRVLLTTRDECHLDLHQLKIDWPLCREMLHVGLPAGINSTFFNISTMTIQTAVNTFGAVVIAGAAAAASIESFLAVAASAFQQMVMPFTAQNFGAGKYPRVVRCCLYGSLLSVSVSFVFGMLLLIFDTSFLRLFSTNLEVIYWGSIRLKVMLSTLFIGALMDLLCGCLRGIGYPVVPAVASLVGACFLRIGWVFLVFPFWRTYAGLMTCYPVSWILVSLFNGLFLWFALKKLFQEKYGSPRLRLSDR